MTFKPVENKSLGYKNFRSYSEYDKCTEKGSKFSMSINKFINMIITVEGVLLVFEIILRASVFPKVYLPLLC